MLARHAELVEIAHRHPTRPVRRRHGVGWHEITVPAAEPRPPCARNTGAAVCGLRTAFGERAETENMASLARRSRHCGHLNRAHLRRTIGDRARSEEPRVGKK